MRDTADHRIDALIRGFDHAVAGVVHDVEIIPATTGQRIGPTLAIEEIGGAVAGQLIFQGVAEPGTRSRSRQYQVLHVGAKRVG